MFSSPLGVRVVPVGFGNLFLENGAIKISAHLFLRVTLVLLGGSRPGVVLLSDWLFSWMSFWIIPRTTRRPLSMA